MRITVKLRRGEHKFEALFDSGASKSIINSETLAANLQTGRKIFPASPTIFDTMSEIFKLSVTTVTQFIIYQPRSDTDIAHRFEVVNDCTDAMIVGRNLMSALGLMLDFMGKLIKWDDCQLQLNVSRVPH